MEIRLDGKTAVVTGASKGIGKAIAAALAYSGANIVLSSRKQASLEQAVDDIRAAAPPGSSIGEMLAIAAHAGDAAQADACVAATVERFGGVDILVNNAATNPYMGPTLAISEAQFDKTVQVNWKGPLLWAQSCWNRSMRRRGGAILNIASIGGLSVETSIGIYNGTKAALLHLTRTLAAELAPGVRVNAIAPGLVKTDMARALWEPNEHALARHVPMRRLGEPEDIAAAAVFLCSDEASWITGTTTVVDGGMLLRA
ncbi:MAG: SDR family oxidoreductase [Acidimicrobiales bacterium]|nr:SDR family oxidoreductase [Acidimicrobiales bacterium]